MLIYTNIMDAVIFDLDGVLVGTPKYGMQSDNKALEPFWVSINEEERKLFEGKSLKIRVPMYEEKFNIKIDFEEFSETFIKTQLDLVKEEIIVSKDRIKSLIKTLKEKGLKVAVVTSARKSKVDQILNWLEVDELLDSLLTSDDVEKNKPHPEPYLKAIDSLKLMPDEVIIIEDSPMGIRSGKAAGVKVIALKTEAFAMEDLSEADEIINSLEEILNFI